MSAGAMASDPIIDWRSVLVRYIKAVMDDDCVVAVRCLTSPEWSPDWTKDEAIALDLVMREIGA